MNCIGWAVKQLHNGDRVRRAGWNGKGMWLTLVGDWNGRFTIESASTKIEGFSAFVAMFTADKKMVPWLCSQTDLLATDWELAG